MLTKANRNIRTLAKQYHAQGFSISESVMLAWESLEPYDSVFRDIGLVA